MPKRKYSGAYRFPGRRARRLTRYAGIKRKFARSTRKSLKRTRRFASVRRNTSYRRRISRGRSIPTRVGFNAPAPKTHWHKRKTSRPDRRLKQLTSTISVEARRDLEEAINVVPDVPPLALYSANASEQKPDHMSCNASLGQRVADVANTAWTWTHLNGDTTTIPWQPDAEATPPIEFQDSSRGGKVGMFMYRFNPLDMENWNQIRSEYEWIRILGMEIIIKPHWKSRFEQSGSTRAPDVQTRMSNMIDYNGVFTAVNNKGFFTDMQTPYQPLNAELFVKKFKSMELTAGGSPYSGTAKFVEYGVNPINIENGRKISIKVKPTSFLSIDHSSTADTSYYSSLGADDKSLIYSHAKIPSQWMTTKEMNLIYAPVNWNNAGNPPALATIGICMKNVPVVPMLTNLSSFQVGGTSTDDGPAHVGGVGGGYTKQLGYATCEVVYHYQVKGTKRPEQIADIMED